MTDLGSREYNDVTGILTPMGAKIEQLICEILVAAGVENLAVAHRIKALDSAVKKITESNGQYRGFDDLHDMLGARVITFLSSDVERAVAALRSEFEVDETRSVDKQSVLDPDRFGYVSYHLVVKVSPKRATLVEWAPYQGIYFEVQVRSILQHAWASIEHDRGYKPASGLPADQKRDFARIAGLLEIADQEFDRVSRESTQRTIEVDREIQTGLNLSVDRDSILALIATAATIEQADREIAESIGAIVDADLSPRYAAARAEELNAVGLATTDAVLSSLESQVEELVRFASEWFLRPAPDEFNHAEHEVVREDGSRSWRILPRGVSLFYLFIHSSLDQVGGEENLIGIRHLEYPEVMDDLRRVHDDAFRGRRTSDRRKSAQD